MPTLLEESTRLCPVEIETWEDLITTIMNTRTPPAHPGPVITEIRWRGDTFIGSMYYDDKEPIITVHKGCYLTRDNRQLRQAIACLTSANHTPFVIRYDVPLGQLEKDHSYCIVWEVCEKAKKKK